MYDDIDDGALVQLLDDDDDEIRGSLPLTCQTWPTVRQGRLVGGQPNHHRRLGILILKAIGYAEKQNMQIGLGSQRLGP